MMISDETGMTADDMCRHGNQCYDQAKAAEDRQSRSQLYRDAVDWFKMSAEHGSSHGQNNLGIAYCEGRGVPLDHAEAARLFGMAADQKDPMGLNNLGYLYDQGWGVPKDEVYAAQLYAMSADWTREDPDVASIAARRAAYPEDFRSRNRLMRFRD
jgi:TPR repeat protein